MNKRQVIMGLGLVVASWFAFVADKTPAADQPARGAATALPAQPQLQLQPQAPAPAAKASDSGTATAPVAILRLRERTAYVAPKGEARRNFTLFGVTGWDPPPPKVAAGPPAAPQAPPLPYSYLGKKFEAGHWEVYLALGEDARVVRAHTRLDEKYRVDTISPPTLSLTYLPLMQVQTLTIGTTE
jgi:hypothetical protein